MNGTNIDKIYSCYKKIITRRPSIFSEDMITDRPERLIISEIVREKALENLQEEVPHGIFVSIDSISERRDKELIDVHATIYCKKNLIRAS